MPVHPRAVPVSYLLTLYITPVIYLYLEKLRHWRRAKEAAVAEPVTVSAGS